MRFRVLNVVGQWRPTRFYYLFMKIQPRSITHDRFKDLIREWLDSHREEYCDFANKVSGRDRQGFQIIFQYAQIIAPQYVKALSAHIADGNEDSIDSLEKVLADADIGTTILNDFQSENPESIAPAMLAWLYFGKSWELMVSYNEELIQEKGSGFLARCMARLIVRAAIKRSIALGHRTKEDWEKFREVQKSMGMILPVTDSTMPEFDDAAQNDATDNIAPEENGDNPQTASKRGRKKVRKSLEELLPENTDRLIERISKYIQMNKSGNHLALLFIFLTEGAHIVNCDVTTFHHALAEKFTDNKFVCVRSVQQAHNQLLTPMSGGQRIVDMGQDKKKLEQVRRHFEAAA